jgi:hypothetical protein
MSVEITTNNVPRDIIDGYFLTADERKEFDYVDWDAIEKGEDSFSAFRYKGQLYDLGEFERVTEGGDFANKGWHGFQSDSYFSGIAVKYADITDMEAGIIVGRVSC